MLTLNVVGNMHTHLKHLKMQDDWNKRQLSGEDASSEAAHVDTWQQNVSGQESPEKQDGQKLETIQRKRDLGGKLTQEEKAHLRRNAPEEYAELVQEERAEKAFAQALRSCRSREEVERLRMSRLQCARETIQDVENDPDIPAEKKLRIAVSQQRQLRAAEEAVREFSEEESYRKLPEKTPSVDMKTGEVTEKTAAKAQEEQVNIEFDETVEQEKQRFWRGYMKKEETTTGSWSQRA